jgi:uncharacterized protein (TIGR03546 family)
MLFLVNLIRKTIRHLKSDLTPAQIAAGVFFGALAGLTPAGLHWVLLFTLAILFNCSMGAFLLVLGLLKPVSLLLGPVGFGLGQELLGGGYPAAESIVRALAEAPVLAYLGFDRYVVAGGYAMAIPSALVLAVLARVAVPLYREKVVKGVGEAAWYQKAMGFRLFRFVHWVFAGKDKELLERKPRFLLLRPFRAYMLPAIPLLYVGLVVGAGIYAQVAVKGLAAEAVSKALGVRCTFGDVRYAFFGQEFGFTHFQLPDPSKTKEDMVRIGGFQADLHFTDLLRGRLHLERLAVQDVACNVERKEDGKLNVTELPAARPAPGAPAGERAAWEDFVKWLNEHGKDVDWSELSKKYAAYREKAAREKAREKEEAKKDPSKRPAPPPYDKNLRWAFERAVPLVRVSRVEVKNLALHVSDRAAKGGGVPSVTHVEATGAELSTRPGWNGAPLTLEGKGKLAGGKSGEVTFRLSVLPDATRLEFGVAAVPLADLRPWYEKSVPVTVEQGRATVTSKGSLSGGSVDLSVNLQLDGLRVSSRQDQPRILGLDEQTSGYAIQGINAYGEKLPIVVGAAVVGPVGDPSLQAKVPFLEIAKKGLEMLGKKELQAYIDKIDGQVAALKQAGAEKLVPLEGSFKNVQDQSVKALQTGDLSGLKESIEKGKGDVKTVTDVKDTKKTVEDAKKTLEDLNPFKKKKDDKK